MIQEETMLEVADNTGAKKLKCIKVLGGSKRRTAQVGDIIVCSVREATPNAMFKVGDVVYVLIVRTTAPVRRADGTQLSFDANAGVIIDKVKRDPRGTRIFGPIPREIKDRNFLKVASAAPEVL